MEPILFRSVLGNPVLDEYALVIADDEQIRAYAMFECPNVLCGLIQMYRDHSKDKKVEHLKLDPAQISEKGLTSERTFSEEQTIKQNVNTEQPNVAS